MSIHDVRRFTAGLDQRRQHDDMYTTMMRLAASAKVDDLPEPRSIHTFGTSIGAGAYVLVEPCDAFRWVRAMSKVTRTSYTHNDGVYRYADGTLDGLPLRVTWVEQL